MWHTINDLVNIKQRHTKIQAIKRGSQTLTSDKDIASALTAHFAESPVALTRNLTGVGASSTVPPIPFTPSSAFLSPTSANEVFNVISSLKVRTATGSDNVPVKVLQLAGTYLSDPLAHVINTSFTTGTFPTSLKYGIVTPIYKGGCKSEAGNYRPIVVLPAASKIFEKIVKKRIESFLLKENLLSPSQYGFRKLLSTELALST
jgi:hypothetical protein